MVKTLVGLAVSMTGGAVLLAWMEPQADDLAANRDLYGWGAFQVAAHRAVASTGGIQPQGWSAVEVLPVADAGLGRRGTLTATTPPDDFHFLVTEEGDLQPLTPWRYQQAVRDGRRVIRIGVLGAPAGGKIPSAQREALRALLLELTGLAGPLRALLAKQGFVD